MSVEPRYNLATKIMSNGVEVIVAGDRSTRPGEPEYLRLLSSTVTRPITLAPHTLSHHMSMLLPAELQAENEVISSLKLSDEFERSTLLTTYIYPTKVIKNEKTSTSSLTTVVTNIKEVNAEMQTEKNKEITLSASPTFESQIHRTVYTYLNTVLDGDQPLVATSKYTVANSIVAPIGQTELEPSESIPETNTYYATREFVRTMTDDTDTQVVSTTDVVTRVVITDAPIIETAATGAPGTIDVTKTYFVTYTYFSTILEDNETKVTSHVSVSTDIAVEQFTMKNKKITEISPTVTKTSDKPVAMKQSIDYENKTNSSSDSPATENTAELTNDVDNDQLAASSGDIIDEWYEKFKIKPTVEIEITKTRNKTKSTIKHKQKTRTSSKVSSSSIEPTSSYSTSVIITSTVTPQGTTLMPGDQVIVIHGSNGDTSMIPLSDPAKKKHKNGTEVQVSDMLSLGALGINSMNVLGPVFNAMADMLKSHQKEALKRRNDTVPATKTPNHNPMLNFVNTLAGGLEQKMQKTTTTPRSPLYIPVGSFAADSDPSESEGRIAILPKPEKYVQEKWPKIPQHLDKNRRTHDNNPLPILEGGIPISPGQVITTNSDVIIGRPSDSWPRPPNFAIKDNVPVDMKPPPVEEEHVHLDPVGQFSTNLGVSPDAVPIDDIIMKPPPLVNRPQQGPQIMNRPPFGQPHINVGRPPQQSTGHHIHPQNPPIQHHPHDSGAYDLNPPPPPPPPGVHHPSSILPIPVHLNPNEIIENYVNPVHLQHDNLIQLNQLMPTPSISRDLSKMVDRSSGHALLVNIQPSQVAQVVIPHGSSTAVIISEEQPHSTKGEVIDDPSPHPEPETVGFIGAEPVLKVENNEILHRPVNAMVEIIKADTILHQQQSQESSHVPQTVNSRPRPDYDNIGMKPPSEPKKHYPQQHPNHHPPTPQHPHAHYQPQYTLSKKDPSGIYVDISPPGHLPPPPKSNKPNTNIVQNKPPPPENLSNHQTGVVHDVPLVAQVQLGSGTPATSTNEIIVNVNDANIHHESQIKQRPKENFSMDLAPPPLPPQVKPPRNPSGEHSFGTIQRFPIPHGKPQFPSLPEPADFMLPPPKPTHNNPMVIPVGAGAPNHNSNSRPGEIMVSQSSDYLGEDDMDTEANDPFKTEDGEEIQESNTRPLLPGQLPTEVEKLLQNNSMMPSNIGVGQTLTFGNSNDKVDDNNPPGVREPETIIGSQMPGSGKHGTNVFNNNNEAVVGVGSKPSQGDSGEVDMSDAEKMFGMKLPSKQKGQPISDDSKGTRNENSNVVFKPPKSDEVMGMSPPPIELPQVLQSRPNPNPPFRFELPSHPNLLSPLNIENDFPPVRTPDANKKPFKPEDVFPPRLPENFVYREYEISTRKPVIKRPSVTSMPIDSPTSSTTESLHDVNGHSKPLNTNFIPESATQPPHIRPKPIVHERPPHVNMQKPTSRPPPRQPPIYENKPPRIPNPPRNEDYHQHPPRHPPIQEGPPRTQIDPDSSKRGQPPFPFERPGDEGSYGDKVRPPSQHNIPPNPPKHHPPRVQNPIHHETHTIRPPPTYEQPPPRVEQPSILEPPPPPRLQTRPQGQRPGYKPPQRKPPPTFDLPPSKPPSVEFNPPKPPNQPEIEHPPKRPLVYDERPTRPPIKFERPSSNEQQPNRNKVPNPVEPGKNDRRPTYPQPTRPTIFEAPPNRVEPSPHFEGHLPQGQSPNDQVHHTTENEKKPVVDSPNYQNGLDQLPESTISNEANANQHVDQKPAHNQPNVYFENKPHATEKIPDEDRHQKLPGRVPSFVQKPVTKPPRIVISTKETIRPTSVVEAKEPTFEVNQSPNIVTSMVTSGSTTIFGDLYTEPMVLHPTRIVTSNQGIHFTVASFSDQPYSTPQQIMVVASTPPMAVHTTTLTVTSTTTTVLHSAGQAPVTKTVLLTTTIISTIVDKVTETETLVKPTTSTVTQTHTISTTKTALVVPTAIYQPRPVKYPSPKPEIFVADPHEKVTHPEIIIADPHEKIVKPEIFVADPREKDTITISVSSSMNKKDQKKDHVKDQVDNESILVVVTDKPSKNGKIDNKILLGGVLSPPISYPPPGSSHECLPECRPTRNELCVRQDGLMKCVCRPGFARMFPDQPCKPTYTYNMLLMLDKMGGDPVEYQMGLQVTGSQKFSRMAEAAKEGLNRMIMQSDLRDIYHGIAISGFQPKDTKTMVEFHVQLSENVDDNRVLGIFKKSLRNSNFSLGGTEMFAAREADNVYIQDFNECLNGKFHDCSEHSRCFNLKGTYTCSCKEGFTDISENPTYPGRLCSDMIGCEFCGYHGSCYTRGEEETCECFQWYTGDRCRINLKVLLIALVTIGAILLALLLVCIVMTCLKRRSSNASKTNGSTGYLRYRGPPQAMDKRAMIVDTSSESSVENLPYVTAPPPPPLPQPMMGPPRKPALRQAKRPAPRPQQITVDQRDRSLTVMIPRVKYRTGPGGAPLSPHMTMSTFSPDKHLNKSVAQIATEQKLLNYLDGGPREGVGQHSSSQRPSKEEKRIYDPKPTNNMNIKKEPRVFEYEYKTSNMNITDGTSSGERRSKDDRFRRYSDQTPQHHEANSLQHRKYSAGALVSAGYAVSATGGIIHDEESTIHSNTLKSNRSQFTTLNRSGDHKTMSEARSYDETLIQPQTRPLRTTYSGSSSSRLHPDENHTMVERDLGSTFLLPESHLFKPAGDRGSDISNFDSL